MSSHATSERRVLGRYVLGPAIGRGATAVVHRARDIVTDETVAVKVVPVELDLAPRVRAEVRAAGRLDHPRIVALRDWGEDTECLYLVWDLIDGRSLADWQRAPERLGDGAIVRIGEDVFAALAHAHRRGVVHRDVKPGNILVDHDGRAHLSDFGVARLSGESGLTLTGGVVGTVAYMSPEQARGAPVGPESDVYSAALVVYEGLCGRNPVSASSPAETARRAAAGGLPPLASARPELPQDLCRAIDAGLRRDPQARPDAAALADALSGARGGVRAARRRGARALPVVACAAAGAALAGVAISTAHGPLADATGLDWRSPAIAAGLTTVSALAFAWRPRLAALTAIVAGAALVGLSAPLAGVFLGALALATLLSGWRFGRITLLAVAGPALAAVGLWPLLPALAGLMPRWAERLWVATAGVVATVVWQVGAGSDSFLAGGGFVGSAVADLDGEGSPQAAAERLWQPLADRPEAALQAAAVLAAAMCVPLVVRARDGGPRVAAACLWIGALGGVLVATSADATTAAGAVIPAAIVVIVWAIRPWRSLRRRGPVRASATLRGPIV
jgi:eukaryotic-like serine/threonine-protein kinase